MNLINNCTIFLKKISARHNSITKLWYALFKYENKLNSFEFCTQMRAHVEKVDVLSWKKSDELTIELLFDLCSNNFN